MQGIFTFLLRRGARPPSTAQAHDTLGLGALEACNLQKSDSLALTNLAYHKVQREELLGAQ
jgi:hypothetical protein